MGFLKQRREKNSRFVYTLQKLTQIQWTILGSSQKKKKKVGHYGIVVIQGSFSIFSFFFFKVSFIQDPNLNRSILREGE